MINALLIAGTDTDAGKTVLTTALVAYWQTYQSHRRLGLMKPLQTGTGDRELYLELFDLDQTPEQITPLHFAAPLAPPLAAEQEGRKIGLEKVWQKFEQLRQEREFVLVEALGGLGSPVTRETTVADLAWDWRIPTVLVVPVRLGAIGQAVANAALARQSRVHLKGIVLNCTQPRSETEIAQWAPADLIESLTGVPVLGLMPHLSQPKDISKLAHLASELDLERLIPLTC